MRGWRGCSSTTQMPDKRWSRGGGLASAGGTTAYALKLPSSSLMIAEKSFPPPPRLANA